MRRGGRGGREKAKAGARRPPQGRHPASAYDWGNATAEDNGWSESSAMTGQGESAK
jgi:hypothetical protein